ncbi:hypothetical protein EJ05DRAFT_478601 [Pseudovirgaria hyperparasitica]|uniref:60S ribosomal subunit assembly/export protein LOC1 n=1 Tax=Pseudovirgaria hyperparasitica TaxID=470096 RepID=A0A6A6W0W2_9PEZI|nr:uncharacterized protein EJ05DRAFT_478601 [Pseudovirgaria hyperparasitica]KAF2755624.1 hypothetical protein EJ05DRAFT_478601 [Pseudovirgaria hyperparasitica]
MAPTKPQSSKSRKPPSSGPKGKVGKSKPKGPPPKPQQVKTKRPTSSAKPKRKVYTEKELDIPKLNMITPAGVQKPKGKKKGKIFVDDQESMMTILAIVNAEKEGQIESKMMKARQMEEIREARRQEAEARQQHKREKLEETKDLIRKSRKRKSDTTSTDAEKVAKTEKPGKKRVSFG